MKVSYPLKKEADIKEIKETLKVYGGRCAKVIGEELEYQVKDEQAEDALKALQEKGYV